MRILIADQNADQRELIKRIYTGHWIREAKHSTEVLAKCKDFDLIFTDVWFPGLGGMLYLHQLHKKTKAKIVLVSTGENHGWNDYIRKPFKRDQIYDYIK